MTQFDCLYICVCTIVMINCMGFELCYNFGGVCLTTNITQHSILQFAARFQTLLIILKIKVKEYIFFSEKVATQFQYLVTLLIIKTNIKPVSLTFHQKNELYCETPAQVQKLFEVHHHNLQIDRYVWMPFKSYIFLQYCIKWKIVFFITRSESPD